MYAPKETLPQTRFTSEADSLNSAQDSLELDETLQALGILPSSSTEISHNQLPTGSNCFTNPTTSSTVPTSDINLCNVCICKARNTLRVITSAVS